jgi:hypothetical protein
MIRSKVFINVTILILLAGCIEPYEFDAGEAEQILVINALFTDLEQQPDIILSYASDYGEGPGEPITGAKIELIFSETETKTYVEIDAGRYRLFDTFAGQEGEQYALRIETAEGKTYECPPQEMPARIVPDSVELGFSTFETLTSVGNVLTNNAIDIFIHSPLSKNGQRGRFRWSIDEAYSFVEIFCGGLDVTNTCYITDIPLNVAEITTFDGQENMDERLERFQISRKEVKTLSPEFNNKHYFNVVQYNLSAASFEYWERSAQVANPSGGIFDAPPAPVLSNMINIEEPEEVVLGFFEVAAVDTIRKSITRAEMNQFIELVNFCPIMGFPNLPLNFPSECCNCLRLPNSSFNIPSYWE